MSQGGQCQGHLKQPPPGICTSVSDERLDMRDYNIHSLVSNIRADTHIHTRARVCVCVCVCDTTVVIYQI